MDNQFQKYFKKDVLEVKRLEHKGNNQLFRVVSDKTYLLKAYSTLQKDNWNRGKTEFKALSFLWKKGFREIPEPFSFNETENIGIYSFEDGKVLKAEEVEAEDMLEAARFLAKLHNLSVEDKKDFPPERTACLSISGYIKLIENRIKTISEDFAAGEEAMNFWQNKIIKKTGEVKEFILNQNKEDLNKEISLEEQVITPGDFGFHNIIKRDKYIFIDFEFFGREDPAKQVLDFLHHDKTKPISRELKSLFLKEYMEKTSRPDSFQDKLKLLDSLIGMNWVLIYLNPLSKTYQEHMKFAGFDNIQEVIKERIAKAREKLENLNFFLKQ